MEPTDYPSGLPPDLQDAAQEAKEDILPQKSKSRYLITYQAFLDWKNEKKIGESSEDCLLIYFDQIIMKKYSPNSAYCHYSMLKSLIKIKENIDISKYYILSAKLKKYDKGYQPKKAATLTGDQVRLFLDEAPDEAFLVQKVKRFELLFVILVKLISNLILTFIAGYSDFWNYGLLLM